MTDIDLRKIQLLNVSAADAVIEASEKVVSRLSKYKQDLSIELLTPLVDLLAFIGKATKDTNQLRRDILKSRLPARIKQLTTNVPAESELLLGDDLNKRTSQINNTNSALAKPVLGQIETTKIGITKIRHPTTSPAIIISNQKTNIPAGGALL